MSDSETTPNTIYHTHTLSGETETGMFITGRETEDQELELLYSLRSIEQGRVVRRGNGPCIVPLGTSGTEEALMALRRGQTMQARRGDCL